MAVAGTAAMLMESMVIVVYESAPAMEMGDRPPVPAPTVVAAGRLEQRIHSDACVIVQVLSASTHAMLPPLPPDLYTPPVSVKDAVPEDWPLLPANTVEDIFSATKFIILEAAGVSCIVGYAAMIVVSLMDDPEEVTIDAVRFTAVDVPTNVRVTKDNVIVRLSGA